MSKHPWQVQADATRTPDMTQPETATAIQDGKEVALPAAPIPQHNRPDGRWCRWSGCTTVQPARLCPDRCQATPAGETP